MKKVLMATAGLVVVVGVAACQNEKCCDDSASACCSDSSKSTARAPADKAAEKPADTTTTPPTK